MIIVIDNRDSFTFNLVQELQGLRRPPARGAATALAIRVVRGADAALEEVLAPGVTGVLIGPGPGEPAGAGVSEAVIRAGLQAKGGPPILGVCLGQQALATATGGVLRRATELVHGSVRAISHDGRGLLQDLPNPLPMARYNSLVVNESSLADCWVVSARTPDGDIAGLRHATLPIEGVQGHPESILTIEHGGRGLLQNFADLCLAYGTETHASPTNAPLAKNEAPPDHPSSATAPS